MTEHPDMYADSFNPALWSNRSVDGKRLTWQEVADEDGKRLQRAERIIAILSDLDRCPHGRHRQDDCTYCQREGYEWNQGNPHLTILQRLGTSLGGKPIVWPGTSFMNSPDAWLRTDEDER